MIIQEVCLLGTYAFSCLIANILPKLMFIFSLIMIFIYFCYKVSVPCLIRVSTYMYTNI